MTANSHTYGSYGPRQAVFGRRGDVSDSRASASGPVFGKRTGQPSVSVSLQRERLRALYIELVTIFSDQAFPDQRPEIGLNEGEPGWIDLGGEARIEIEGGTFAFRRTAKGTLDVYVTTSIDRLMDAVLAHFTDREEADSPASQLALVDRCVGRTVKDVERTLILATLRHCHGNRTHAARMLGISLRTLRNKLHGYWRELIHEREGSPAAGEGDPAANDAVSVGISYSGQLGDGISDHGLRGNLSWKF